VAKEDFPVQRLCRVLGVSPSGYFAWRSRPASPRQREDLVLLAHIRLAFTLSNGTYGSPRMKGLTVGQRRTAQLMRENSLKARQKRRFKRTTDSHHAFPIAPNLLEQDFSAKGKCYDNSVVEAFFKTLKSELVWRTVFQTRAEAKAAIGRYVDGFYNPVWRHSTLDYVSPVQFEGLAG
jgi:transposase InsO family protein